MTDRLDDAIDRAVREMLDVEPRADLRARVIAQLPAAGFRLRGARWIVAPLAAAALIVLAVFVVRRSEPIAPHAPVVAHAGDSRLPADTSVGAPSQPAPAATAMPPAPASVRAGRRAPEAAPHVASTIVAASFDPADARTIAIEPLHSIAPITIAPLAQNTIAPAEIAMHPLNPISDVQIAPLTPSDRRN